MNNLENAISYYSEKGKAILDKVNSKTNITADELIEYGEEMAIIEYKLTALEVAKTS